jgi:hypothetical protein
MSDTETKDEGPRSFTHFLAGLDMGAIADDASHQLRDLVKQLTVWAEDNNKTAKGTLTLKLSLSVDPTSLAKVGADITTKAPKRIKRDAIMWVDGTDNLVASDPRQQGLPGVRLVAGKAAADRAGEAKVV